METEKYSPKWLLNEIRNAESDAHALFKIIEFQKALTEQCNIADVVGRSEQLAAIFEKMNRHHITMLEIGDYDKLAKEMLSS